MKKFKIILIIVAILVGIIIAYNLIFKGEMKLTVKDGEKASVVTVELGKRYARVEIPQKRANEYFCGYYSEPNGGGEKLISSDGFVTEKYTRFMPEIIYPKWLSIYELKENSTVENFNMSQSRIVYADIPETIYNAMAQNQEKKLKITITFDWYCPNGKKDGATAGLLKEGEEYDFEEFYFANEGITVPSSLKEEKIVGIVTVSDFVLYDKERTDGFYLDDRVRLAFDTNTYSEVYIKNIVIMFEFVE